MPGEGRRPRNSIARAAPLPSVRSSALPSANTSSSPGATADPRAPAQTASAIRDRFRIERSDNLRAALRELTGGCERASRSAEGASLAAWLDRAPDELSLELIAVVLRCVFLAELAARLPAGTPLRCIADALVSLGEGRSVEVNTSAAARGAARPVGLFSTLLALFQVLHDGGVVDGVSVPAHRGSLFRPGDWPLAPIPDDAVVAAVRHIVAARASVPRGDAETLFVLGASYESLLGARIRRSSVTPDWELVDTEVRRRSGSHYTPAALAADVVERTLRPLVVPDRAGVSAHDLDALSVCDPAMGCGAMLVAACRWIGARRAEATGESEGEGRVFASTRCLYGVDRDPLAVALAALSVWWACGVPTAPLDLAESNLRVGDALVDAPLELDRATRSPASRAPFDWGVSFRDVMARGGFSAFIGNPPWVSYAGRAAQPIPGELRRWYATRYESFAGYRNLQGMFAERAATLLRPGGRLGLILPSSMAEQSGYAPTRAAHDALCVPDEQLPDLGEESFDGVFQPCMVLLSTRREARVTPAPRQRWNVERPDLDEAARMLLARFDGPTLPAHLFGERGLQSSGRDTDHLAAERDAEHDVPMRVGADVAPFERRAPSRWASRAWFGARLRRDEDWKAVRVLVRQTARVPMATLSDGMAFRNSVLAGFADETYPAELLVAWLNATPIRWVHWVRHRDARQGMPQVKIGHLRALPAPPDTTVVELLTRWGAEWSHRNTGLSPDEQRRIDEAVSDAFGLSPDERARIATWWEGLR